MPPLSYASQLKLTEVANGVSKYEATTGLKESLILYGLGDHGGGPNREILDRVRGYGRLALAPKFVHTTPSPFLQQKRKEKLDLPLWKDELYLEYHQGTFTTQGAIKKNNRRTESLLATTEKLAAIAFLLGGELSQGRAGEKLEERSHPAVPRHPPRLLHHPGLPRRAGNVQDRAEGSAISWKTGRWSISAAWSCTKIPSACRWSCSIPFPGSATTS